MNKPIISVSGLRGIVGESLDAQLAARYANAFAAEVGDGAILISRDGRASGKDLAEAIAAGLRAIGRRVIDAGVAATPTTGVLVRQQDAAGGIQITASHNPAEYNGLKLFSAAGRVIPEPEGARVKARFEAQSTPTGDATAAAALEECRDATSRHLSLVMDTLDVEPIRQRRYKVLLDANHGAGGLLGSQLLAELGCQVTLLGGQPNGQFAHTPEPTAENLADVLAAVPAHGCDVGFCQDPDADRLAVIDADGRYLGEEYTLAICVEHRLRAERGAIVTNCSTSRMAQDIAERHDVPFARSAVGEANVVDAMLARRAILGGEGNGGVIDPRVGLVRDSFVAIGMILDCMALREMPVAALADELPRYEIVKTKIALPREHIDAGLAAVEQRFPDAQADRLDGLRLDWPDKWLLVRASNTEPIVRAVAEAPSVAEAQRLCRQAGQALSGF